MDGNNSGKVIYCSQCGKPNYPEANFCSRCGKNLNENFNSGDQASGTGYDSGYQNQQEQGTYYNYSNDSFHNNYYNNYYDTGQTNDYYWNYAGFWRRFAAIIIDSMILGLVSVLLDLVLYDPPER